MEQLKLIDDKTQFTNAYHLVMATSEAFCRISSNIPRPLLKVQQSIHEKLHDSAYDLFVAGNSRDYDEKLHYLNDAQRLLFFMFSSLEYLVKAKAITIGSTNEVISLLSQAHTEVKKWLNSTIKNKSLI